jgi:hypothetical protein
MKTADVTSSDYDDGPLRENYSYPFFRDNRRRFRVLWLPIIPITVSLCGTSGFERYYVKRMGPKRIITTDGGAFRLLVQPISIIKASKKLLQVVSRQASTCFWTSTGKQ